MPVGKKKQAQAHISPDCGGRFLMGRTRRVVWRVFRSQYAICSKVQCLQLASRSAPKLEGSERGHQSRWVVFGGVQDGRG